MVLKFSDHFIFDDPVNVDPMQWELISTSKNAETSHNYLVDTRTNVVTLRLPPDPTDGDSIRIRSAYPSYSTNNLYVESTNNIKIGCGTVLRVGTNNIGFSLVYAKDEWKIYDDDIMSALTIPVNITRDATTTAPEDTYDPTDPSDPRSTRYCPLDYDGFSLPKNNATGVYEIVGRPGDWNLVYRTALEPDEEAYICVGQSGSTTTRYGLIRTSADGVCYKNVDDPLVIDGYEDAAGDNIYQQCQTAVASDNGDPSTAVFVQTGSSGMRCSYGDTASTTQLSNGGDVIEQQTSVSAVSGTRRVSGTGRFQKRNLNYATPQTSPNTAATVSEFVELIIEKYNETKISQNSPGEIITPTNIADNRAWTDDFAVGTSGTDTVYRFSVAFDSVYPDGEVFSTSMHINARGPTNPPDECPAGYTLSNGTCVLDNPRANPYDSYTEKDCVDQVYDEKKTLAEVQAELNANDTLGGTMIANGTKVLLTAALPSSHDDCGCPGTSNGTFSTKRCIEEPEGTGLYKVSVINGQYILTFCGYVEENSNGATPPICIEAEDGSTENFVIDNGNIISVSGSYEGSGGEQGHPRDICNTISGGSGTLLSNGDGDYFCNFNNQNVPITRLPPETTSTQTRKWLVRSDDGGWATGRGVYESDRYSDTESYIRGWWYDTGPGVDQPSRGYTGYELISVDTLYNFNDIPDSEIASSGVVQDPPNRQVLYTYKFDEQNNSQRTTTKFIIIRLNEFQDTCPQGYTLSNGTCVLDNPIDDTTPPVQMGPEDHSDVIHEIVLGSGGGSSSTTVEQILNANGGVLDQTQLRDGDTIYIVVSE